MTRDAVASEASYPNALCQLSLGTGDSTLICVQIPVLSLIPEIIPSFHLDL